MATPVVTVAAGGLPVVDVTATTPKLGLPVTEALNGRGIAVTKVAANGLPVTFKAAGNEWPFPPNPPPTGGGGTASAEVTAWLARATTLDVTHIAADTAFIDGLVADGIWSKNDAIYVPATQNSATALLNMASASYTLTVHNAPTFTADRGYTFNGITGAGGSYLNTHLNPATSSLLKQNDGHISVWVVNNLGNAAGFETGNAMGCADGGPEIVSIQPANTNGNFNAFINDGGLAGTASSNSKGHFLGTRLDNTNIHAIRNGTGVTLSAVTSGSPPNAEMYVGGINNNGVTWSSLYQIAAVTIGAKLTDAEALKLFNRLATRLTAVGVP